MLGHNVGNVENVFFYENNKKTESTDRRRQTFADLSFFNEFLTLYDVIDASTGSQRTEYFHRLTKNSTHLFYDASFPVGIARLCVEKTSEKEERRTMDEIWWLGRRRMADVESQAVIKCLKIPPQLDEMERKVDVRWSRNCTEIQ
jgi:hypothetical protein